MLKLSVASESGPVPATPSGSGAREQKPDGRDTFFGVIDAVTALVVVLGVFGGLPVRWWPVDLAALVVTGGLAATATGLLSRARWGRAVGRITSAVLLVIGLGLVSALVLSAAYLRGVYGPVGAGGSLILVLVAALVIPYFVVFQASQWIWFATVRAPTAFAAQEPPVVPTARANEVAVRTTTDEPSSDGSPSGDTKA